MKSLVVYSSLTGNTERVARAVYEALPEPKTIAPVADAPDPAGFDFVAIGYWVDKGMPDSRAQKFMATVQGAHVGLFGTLGAEPDSDHAKECIRKGEELMAGNIVHGSFLCQGRIDPKIIEAMQKMAADVHPMTPERIARIKEAEKHPDEQDLANAREAFAGIIQSAKEAMAHA